MRLLAAHNDVTPLPPCRLGTNFEIQVDGPSDNVYKPELRLRRFKSKGVELETFQALYYNLTCFCAYGFAVPYARSPLIRTQ